MSLWGKTDQEENKPKYQSGTPLNAQEVSNLDSTFGVDAAEAQTESNRAKGIKTPGWVQYRTYIDGNGNVRHKSEVLVAFGGSSTAESMGDANDDEVIADPVITIDVQPQDTTYIVSPADVTLSVEASINGNTELKYQWWDTDAEEQIDGQTSATLSLTEVTAPRHFQVAVMADGANVVWSNIVNVLED